jgi:hypothetical protein
VTIGEGIFKSTDGGGNWTKMGLEKTERIASVQINPKNPDVVYAAAMGPLWGPGTDRGLFKTTDGGKTWEKILYVDENTGCSEVTLDPRNPDIVYAAMWEHRRTAWSFESGGHSRRCTNQRMRVKLGIRFITAFHRVSLGVLPWRLPRRSRTGCTW